MATLICTGGGTPEKTPDYGTKLIVHVATSDNGSPGNTRVRIRNEQLGANYTRPLDSLGNATFELLENRTYYVILLDYPTKYYGGAALVTASSGQVQEITITLKTEPDIVGWRMNESNGEIEYTDGAEDFLPAQMKEDGTLDMGSWKDSWLFRNIRPCMLKNGVVQYYLNPNDYSKRIDGSAADITSGDDGDVMIEFPLVYYKYSTKELPDGTIYSGCQFSLTPQDDTWCANAFLSENGVVQTTMYRAAYDGIDFNGKLRSISGVTPGVVKFASGRSLAKANGKGYQQLEHSKRAFWQSLMVLMMKETNLYRAIGNGVTDSSFKTGMLNDKGMYFRDPKNKRGVKFFGIENMYGLNKWCEGLYISSKKIYYKIRAPFEGSYQTYNCSLTYSSDRYIHKMSMSNEYGMLPKSTLSGSTGAYFNDYIYLSSSSSISYTRCDGTGPFWIDMYFSSSNSTYTCLTYTPQGG